MPDDPDVSALPAQRAPTHDALPPRTTPPDAEEQPSPAAVVAAGPLPALVGAGPDAGSGAAAGQVVPGSVGGGPVVGPARPRRWVRAGLGVVGALAVLLLGVVILKPDAAP